MPDEFIAFFYEDRPSETPAIFCGLYPKLDQAVTIMVSPRWKLNGVSILIFGWTGKFLHSIMPPRLEHPLRMRHGQGFQPKPSGSQRWNSKGAFFHATKLSTRTVIVGLLVDQSETFEQQALFNNPSSNTITVFVNGKVSIGLRHCKHRRVRSYVGEYLDLMHFQIAVPVLQPQFGRRSLALVQRDE
mgnify:CR=1 FL=1